ncbi:hypothetical protein GGQ02_003291, partial [Salinibacter ruber]|nr:hypothetical protein [Salinibacter ruber]
KHTSERKDDPFNLSGLKKAIEGFSERFVEVGQKDEPKNDSPDLRFSIVTNRPISQRFKKNVEKIGEGETAEKQFQETIETYTGLSGESLSEFCRSLSLIDSERGYAVQRHQLQSEISALVAGSVESALLDKVEALVREQALPKSSGEIYPEDILRRFGVTSKKELFPAPFQPEDTSEYIERDQKDSLLEVVQESSEPVLIHASGGVGKTVVGQQLCASVPNGALGVLYDCFGAGDYRARTSSRHRHSTALVQIANEIALSGMCHPLLPVEGRSDEAIMRTFISRLQQAVSSLREVDPDAFLVVMIDAADNAEMAASEFNESCFAGELLREQMPDGCQLVMLSRTERIELLDPPSFVRQVELDPFTRDETLAHLRKTFPDVSEEAGYEFYRLTGGNPRVQANALDSAGSDIQEVLEGIGPSPTTVEEQIESQLEAAINELKDERPEGFRGQVDALCIGLANLPPLIPIDVLAEAAEVEPEIVKSFVADIGRPLWLSDDSVQFRDEPTESWFRERYAASTTQIEQYVSRLEPLATEFSYVAEALPSLLLQSEQYDRLIELALSDELLPTENPIDARNIRVYRLQFAFKAALRQERYPDAAKLAFRAGEEMAGDSRQYDLLSENTDLIAPLQSNQRVQELAYRGELAGAWEGSENVYSASLLSSVQDFHGEAQGYLRAAHRWLDLYFREREKRPSENGLPNENLLKDEHLVELATSHLNLRGTEAATSFITSWRPREIIFRVTQLLVRRLVDRGEFETISKLATLGCREPHLTIAVAEELIKVGRTPPAEALDTSLILMANQRTRVSRPSRIGHQDKITPAIISFAEACAGKDLSDRLILRVVRHYTDYEIPLGIWDRHFEEHRRDVCLRQVALRKSLSGATEKELEGFLSDEVLGGERDRHTRKKIENFKQVAGGLLPWYELRFHLLTEKGTSPAVQEVREESRSARSNRFKQEDFLDFELASVRFRCLMFNDGAKALTASEFANEIAGEDQQLSLSAQLTALRAAHRLDHLESARDQLEQGCREMIENRNSAFATETANEYIRLARAVLPTSSADAAAYFDLAVEAVSKFGNEVIDRWMAVDAMAERSTAEERSSPRLAYRFARCSELVGDHVAREKHAPRSESIRTTVSLHPPTAFATLSRWRDRRVGRPYEQLPALARKIVETETVAPAVGYSLSALYSSYFGYEDFCAVCLERESDSGSQQYIFETTLRDLRLNKPLSTRNDGSEAKWGKMEELADRYSLHAPELSKITTPRRSRDPEANPPYRSEANSPQEEQSESSNPDWDTIFSGLELTSSQDLREGLDQLARASAAQRRPNRQSDFWKECCKRVTRDEAVEFIHAAVHTPQADFHEIKRVLQHVEENWKRRPSIQQAWDEVLRSFGKEFATDLTNRYTFKHFTEGASDSEIQSLREGVLEGLAGTSDLTSGSTFFGSIHILTDFVSTEAARDVLSYALSRFEIHVEPDFADGPWDDWLVPPESTTEAFSGFVWAALGSPRSETRWRAAHCVRRLADLGCEAEIDALIEWMERDEVGAFGGQDFPFYNLHARLYLFIALARVAEEQPDVLREHHAVFERHALNELPHALIQKFAAEAALSVQQAFPSTYDTETARQLSEVGVSKMPTRDISRTDTLTTPWHSRGEADQEINFSFDLDFDQYWFKPLARVFGISTEQVEDLAREIAVKEWGVETDGRFVSDPRRSLWRLSGRNRETSHSHSSYPRTDTYSFYVSYHAMLSVAARLLSEMPVMEDSLYGDNAWIEWFQRHDITRADRKWLADRRDPPPLARPNWAWDDTEESWYQNIQKEDFLDVLSEKRDGRRWLNVFGDWQEHDSRSRETRRVQSAFVSSEGAQALLNALATCSNPYDYKLPYSGETGMEFDYPPFTLRGWTYREEVERGIDKLDPHAGDISYPPYCIGEQFADQFNLTPHSEGREWTRSESGEPVLTSRLWGKYIVDDREGPVRGGSCLSASLKLLKEACSRLNSNLIIEVQLSRYPDRTYSGRRNDPTERGEKTQIFLLSEDGELRGTEAIYRIGESDC